MIIEAALPSVSDLDLHDRGELYGHIADWTSKYGPIFETIGIPEGKLLDVGSYNVRLRKWLFRNGHNGSRVVSVDIRDIRMPYFDLVRATGRALPFADNSFDHVLSLGALPSLVGEAVSEKSVVCEMFRVAAKSLIIWPPPTIWGGSPIRTDEEIDKKIKERTSEMISGECSSISVINQPEIKMFLPSENRIVVISK